MATIAQNLQTIIQTKSDIKAALEGKGQDLSNVPFTGYARVIDDMKMEAAQLEKIPIEITENGEYTPPKGVTYDPIIVKAKAQDEPLTITENNTEIIAPEGIRHNPIMVAILENYQEKSVLPTKEEQVIVADEGYKALSQVVVEPIPDGYVLDSPELHPTLNAPTIGFNANGGFLSLTDYRNGNFVDFYRLYINGEDTGKTFTNKTITMTEYGISETDEIEVEAVGNLFNTSPKSNPTKWSDLMEGTIGLTYNGGNWTGLGTATAKDIYIASIVNGTTITSISTNTMQSTEGYTVHLPDTMTSASYSCFNYSKDLTIVFGTSMATWRPTIKSSQNVLFDCRRATKVFSVEVDLTTSALTAVVVPDDLYDEWITTTNWVKQASKIVRATDYEKQQGGTI